MKKAVSDAEHAHTQNTSDATNKNSPSSLSSSYDPFMQIEYAPPVVDPWIPAKTTACTPALAHCCLLGELEQNA
jgi:hypothetical protein